MEVSEAFGELMKSKDNLSAVLNQPQEMRFDALGNLSPLGLNGE